MKRFQYILLTAILLATLTGFSQQMNQKIEMQLDALGNANLNISMKMNAAQWQTWLQTMGNNPAALKREIEREMPGFFLDDFKLEKNDMERSFDLSLKAYGICKVDKRGNWVLETDSKDIDITELTERKYMFVNSPAELGGQVQQTTIVEFPEEASAIQIDEDAYGKTIFEFDMEGGSNGFNFLLWIGLALLIAGIGWAVFTLMNGEKVALAQ